MINNRATLVQLQQQFRELNPEKAKIVYMQRINKLDQLLLRGKNVECVKLTNKLREENFENMFDMEKFVHILNSLK